MKKSILFLGAGHLQELSIKSAKNMGFNILAVDINAEASSAPFCDHFLNCDSTDAAAIYDWCMSFNNQKIEAVWANNDILIPTRVSLECALNVKVPHASHKCCFDLLSKALSSKLLYSSGFVPKQLQYNNEINPSSLNYPLIVKPKKGSGSEGVKMILSLHDLKNINFNPEKEIIEEYISGTEYGTNHFYDGENIYKLPAVRRYFDHGLTMVPLGTVIADMNDKFLLNSYSHIEDIIIKNNWLGPMKADIFINGSNFNIIEMSPRFHGEIDTTYVFNQCGLNIADKYFSYLAFPDKHNWNNNDLLNLDTYAGYISICNQNVIDDNKFIEESLLKYNLKFVNSIKSGNNTLNKHIYPKSTADLKGFIFYNTSKELNDNDFSSLFKKINLIEE